MMKRSRCGSVGRALSARRMLPRMTGYFLTVAAAIATPTAAMAADNAASVNSEAIFIAELGLLLVVGRLMGEAAQRLGQPAVMGQLIGGLLLGPSVLGLIWPAAQHALFPGTPEQKSMINAVSQLGILMLLLLTGMETDLQLVKRVGRAAVTGAAAGGALPFICGWSRGRHVLGPAAFMAASLTVGRRIVFYLIRWTNDNFKSEFPVITVILLIMIAMALITQLIGVNTVLGAFVAGILIGESPILTRHIDEKLRGLIVALFMPVFFGLSGLSADLTVLKNPALALLALGLIAIASVGKFLGAFVGGKLGGLTRAESLALGCGMNARGSTEVIVATIGLSMGVLNRDLFPLIVTMAIVTTMAMPPMLRWALKRLPMRKKERIRLEREELDAKSFVTNLERLLLAADDSANGKFASPLAGVIAGSGGKPTTIVDMAKEDRSGKAAKSKEPAT